MNNCENITGAIFRALEKENTKSAGRVRAWLDLDYANIVEYRGTWWLECNLYRSAPEYVRAYLKSYLKRTRGLKYLYEGM